MRRFQTKKLYQLCKAKTCEYIQLLVWQLFFEFKHDTAFRLKSISVSCEIKHCQIATSRMVIMQHPISFSRIGSKELCHIYSDMVGILTKVQFAHFSQKESFYHTVKRCATGIKKVVMRCATNTLCFQKVTSAH